MNDNVSLLCKRLDASIIAINYHRCSITLSPLIILYEQELQSLRMELADILSSVFILDKKIWQCMAMGPERSYQRIRPSFGIGMDDEMVDLERIDFTTVFPT